MDRQTFEGLLWQQEGDALDFKKEQYRFQGGTEDEKGELLKDILAFVNAWRSADAHILIGAEEVRGGRAIAHGVPGADHLQEHSLQQFVNFKVNAPVQFTYEVFDYDGAKVGVITIPSQPRPRYLKQDYGRLKRDVVYVRRGSATVQASVDEIAQMGAANAADPTPALTAHLKHEIEQNVRELFTISSSGQMVPKSFDGSFVRSRFNGGWSDECNYLGKHLVWLGMFLTFHLGSARHLRADALADAISSGRFLEFDRATSMYAVGILQRGMLDLQRYIRLLQRAAEMNELADQGNRLIQNNRSRLEQTVRVRNSELVVACCVYDQFENVTTLLRAVYMALEGDDTTLRTVGLRTESPISAMTKGAEAETPTQEMIRDWLRQQDASR